jgi:hypothetical protein
MKKLIFAMSLILSVGLTGCMQMEMTTVLDKNGGGTYAFTMTMSKEVEDALNEMSQLEGDMGEEMDDVPDFANFDKNEYEKRLKEYGVKVKTFGNEIKDGVRTVNMVLEFKDIRGLQASMASMMGGEDGIVITKLDNGDYRLESGDSGIVFDDEEAEDPEPEKEPSMEDMQAAMANAGKSMEIMGKLMAHSSELAMTMNITLPGDVIDHNAHSLDGRTCTWKLNSQNMMNSAGMEPRITFSGDGVNIK